jgi:hypothetical protein
MRSGSVYGHETLAHDFAAVRDLGFPGDKRRLMDMRIALTDADVRDLDRRIAQLDDMVRAATRRGYTRTAMRLVDDQARAAPSSWPNVNRRPNV